MQGLRNAGLEESTRVSCGFALTWSVVLTLVTIRIVRVLSELLVLGHTPDQLDSSLGDSAWVLGLLMAPRTF